MDFNQGIDLRLLTVEKMKRLATIALKPLRLAFDNIGLKAQYRKCVRQAVDCGIRNLSTYVLYNYRDTPQDFYDRLRINVEINEELGVLIYSFPMKFIPLDAKDRRHVGRYWNRRLLRGVQCILLATMGKVGTHLDFFEAAFGRTADEFIEIAMMPDEYIINRARHKNDGAAVWLKEFRRLSPKRRTAFLELAGGGSQGFQRMKRTYPALAGHYPAPRESRV